MRSGRVQGKTEKSDGQASLTKNVNTLSIGLGIVCILTIPIQILTIDSCSTQFSVPILWGARKNINNIFFIWKSLYTGHFYLFCQCVKKVKPELLLYLKSARYAKQNNTLLLLTNRRKTSNYLNIRHIYVNSCRQNQPAMSNSGYCSRRKIISFSRKHIHHTFQPSRFSRETPEFQCPIPLSSRTTAGRLFHNTIDLKIKKKVLFIVSDLNWGKVICRLFAPSCKLGMHIWAKDYGFIKNFF